MSRNKAIIIATQGLTTNLLYNSLIQDFDVVKVILEKKENRTSLLKRRIEKIGFFKVLGQINFLLFVLPFLKFKKRQSEIIQEYQKKNDAIPASKIEFIEDANNEKSIELLKKFEVEIIFINGTRILSEKLLDQIKIPVLNIHTGITPKYRGVHGGYWALYNQDFELFGTTLHIVDSGIDTGTIIDQASVKVSKKDNFKTYPILQYCLGLELIQNNIDSIKNGEIPRRKSLSSETKLYTHPGACNYLWKRISKGIK